MKSNRRCGVDGCEAFGRAKLPTAPERTNNGPRRIEGARRRGGVWSDRPGLDFLGGHIGPGRGVRSEPRIGSVKPPSVGGFDAQQAHLPVIIDGDLNELPFHQSSKNLVLGPVEHLAAFSTAGLR